MYTNQGNYTIHLTVTGSNQCFDDTSISTLAVHLLPVPEFIASQSAMCQTPAIVHLNNQSTGAISYEWFTPALGVFSQASDPVISFQSTVQLPVTLIAETPFCRDSVTHPVFAYAETQAGFISDTLAGCQPLTLQFEDSSKNVTSLLWDFGNNNFSNSSSPSFYYSEAGIYQATLYANYDSVCFDSASVQINILDGPDADFTYRDTTIDDMVFHQFFNQSQCDDTCTFLWAFDDAEFSTLENPIHQYWSNARRCVSLTITSSNGCLSTKIICLDINLPGVLSIPNALIPTLIPDLKGYFAPNGYNLETFEIEIVSPWGERVWHSLNELDENGTPTSKWNGTHYQNGNDLPMGVYVWRVLKATFRNHMEWKGMIYENNTDPIKCGSVLLTR